MRTILLALSILVASLALAADSPWTKDVRSARAAIERDDFALAESFLNLALQSARSEGEVDGRIPSAYEALAEEYGFQELPDDAIRASKMAIHVWKEVGGANEPRVATSMSALAQAHESAGRLDEAEKLLVEAIHVLAARYGEDGAEVAGAEERLAKHYESRSRYEDASEHYKRAYQILTESLGAESPLVVPTVRDYIGVLRKMNQHSEAVDLESLLQQMPPVVQKRVPGVKMPRLISKQEPGYSEEARTVHVEGRVVLLVAIDETGVPSSVWVKEPAGFGLDEKAVEAVSSWRFEPGEKDGKPTKFVATIEVNMRLL